jgi:hypothetical protein
MAFNIGELLVVEKKKEKKIRKLKNKQQERKNKFKNSMILLKPQEVFKLSTTNC